MKITIKDIAKMAGVSHSTVSRSLNDSPQVSEKTRNRIKKLASDLGFEFNASARGLSTSKTGTIGIIFTKLFDEVESGVYLGYLMHNIQQNLEDYSYDCIITQPHNDKTGESNLVKLISKRKVDGLLIAVQTLSKEEYDFLLKNEIPHVFFHYKPIILDENKSDFVYTNHLKGGYIATEHLLRLGYEKIAVLTGNKNELEFEERTKGYEEALEKFRREFENELVLRNEISFYAGYNSIKNNIEKVKGCDAIFSQSDIMALGAIEALKEYQIEVPKDIAVVGYDDIDMGRYFYPKLTTVHQPNKEMADIVCKRIFELINNDSEAIRLNEVLTPKLIIRESCGYRIIKKGYKF